MNSSESWIFWSSLLVYPVVWVFFMFVCLIKLSPQWLVSSVFSSILKDTITDHNQVVTVIGTVLNGANVVGYIKCRKDTGSKLTSMAGQLLGQQILKQVTTRSDCCYYDNLLT